MASEVFSAREGGVKPINAQRTGKKRKASLDPKTEEYLKSERKRYLDMMYENQPAKEREYIISAVDRIDEYLRGDRPWV